MTPRQLAKKFSKAPARESVVAAVGRAASFAKAMRADGHEELLAGRLGKVKEPARAQHSTTGVASKVIARAEKRFGAPLPVSVVELWSVLGCSCHGAFLRAFCSRRVVDPRELVAPPAWARDARLSCVRSMDGSGASDTRERFEGGYERRFADADPKTKISTPEALARKKPRADRRTLVVIDPSFRGGIIALANAPSEHWFVVTGLASKAAPAPMFAKHDDGEGFSEYVATDVRAWFSSEITASMLDIAARED